MSLMKINNETEYIPYNQERRKEITSLILNQADIPCGGVGINFFPNLQELIFENDVTNIFDCSFSHHEKLRKIVFPSSLETIGFSAFADCYKLSEITLSSGVRYIYSYAFSNCNLKTIHLPDTIKSIGEGSFEFNRTESLTWDKNLHIDSIGNFPFKGALFLLDTKKYDQAGCLYLANVLLSANALLSKDPANVTIKEGTTIITTGSLKNIKSLTIPRSLDTIHNLEPLNIDCVRVQDAEYWGRIKIDSYGSFSVSHLFSLASQSFIREIVVPDEVSMYHYASNKDIEKITIRENVKYLYRTAFSHMPNLKQIVCEGVEAYFGDNLIAASDNIEKITVHPNCKIRNFFKAFQLNGKHHIKNITIPENEKAIPAYFAYNSNIETLSIHKGIKSIYKNAFIKTHINNLYIPEGKSKLKVGCFTDCVFDNININDCQYTGCSPEELGELLRK